MKTALPSGLKARLFLYNLFFPFGLLAMLPGLLARMLKRGQYRHKFGQRFGYYDAEVAARLAGKSWTWIHSISVGETLLALKLARKMKELDPSLNVVLSATTSTGFALAEKATAEWLEPIYNPLDAPFIVRRALRAVRPQRLIFIEAIWPNLLALARETGAPVSLIARLSPRSERRFRKFRFWTAPMFRALDRIFVQEPDDIARWQSLGASAESITVTGNIKFDEPSVASPRGPEFRELLAKLGVKPNAPILLAGSTFPGEETILAEAFRSLRNDFPELFLIIVPRHVERTGEAVADVIRAGLSVALRTAPEPRSADCLLINTTGELRDWYGVATVVFIGKSLTAVGGQNPVEAVLAGSPVVFGPHMENFAPIVAQWLRADAAVQVASAADLTPALHALLAGPARRATLVARAREIIAQHTGATARTARALLGK